MCANRGGWNRSAGHPVQIDMLEQLLRDHDGVITLAQAQHAGLNRQAVYRRVRSGRWRRCSPGVYFVDDRLFTDRARIRAAVWGYGPRATASGLAAAWWHEITRYPPETVEVTVPAVSNPRRRYALRTRRRDLDPADCVTRHGLRVTALPLTVLEAATRRGGGMKIVDAARTPKRNGFWSVCCGRRGSPASRSTSASAAGRSMSSSAAP
jgi:predicted transcriptional regulator of viral defense system